MRAAWTCQTKITQDCLANWDRHWITLCSSHLRSGDMNCLGRPIQIVQRQSRDFPAPQTIVDVLAARGADEALTLKALAAETFILYRRHNGPGLYDAILTACNAAHLAHASVRRLRGSSRH